MIVLKLIQGAPEWHAHRAKHWNASDAPAMMGASPYVTRAELIRQRATGIQREIDPATQRVFDRGHKVEPVLRAMAEKIIGEPLYPITGVSDDGYLSASFDGVTMDETTIFEAKQSNGDKAEIMARGEIPPVDYWQIVQQFAVCESAVRCIYAVGDGTEDGTVCMQIDREQVEDDIPALIEAWRQFDADVAAYEPEPEAPPAPAGKSPETLPALRVEVTGSVLASNLEAFRSHAMDILGAINRDLQTDDDFANAEATVKWAKGVEDRLAATKANVLGQMESIDSVCRTIDEITAETRRIRLDLDKLVKAEKENRKAEIVRAGVQAVRDHYDAINATLGGHQIAVPMSVTSDIGASIKGLKTLSSMRDKIDAAVANAKIAASQLAETIRANIAILSEHKDHSTLFADRVTLCATKHPDDLRNLVAARIAEHEAREKARLDAEREKIRKEEAEKLERERAERESRDAEAAAGRSSASDQARMRPAGSPAPTAYDAGDAQQSAVGSEDRPVYDTGASLKLGEINAAIAPLSISAEGLAQLGFEPVRQKGAAKLYAASEFGDMCVAMVASLNKALQRKAA